MRYHDLRAHRFPRVRNLPSHTPPLPRAERELAQHTTSLNRLDMAVRGQELSKADVDNMTKKKARSVFMGCATPRCLRSGYAIVASRTSKN
jgi:hypothetical protein